jgi:hypothetical protein
MRSLLNTCRNLQKTLQSGQSIAEILVRFRRNAGQFKTGTLVGTDEYGNKYYEDQTDENVNNLSGTNSSLLRVSVILVAYCLGRDRWVEFPTNIKERTASAVPPEWYEFDPSSFQSQYFSLVGIRGCITLPTFLHLRYSVTFKNDESIILTF